MISVVIENPTSTPACSVTKSIQAVGNGFTGYCAWATTGVSRGVGQRSVRNLLRRRVLAVLQD